MDSQNVRRNRIVFVLLILASFVVLTLALRDSDFYPLQVAHRVVTGILSPVQRVAVAIYSPVAEAVGTVGNFASLRRDNEMLKAEVVRLRHDNSVLKAYRDEAGRLKSLMGEKRRMRFKTVPAQVVSVVGPWQSVITVDKGKSDGVAERMPVVAAGGVAGQVVEVRQSTSTIRLINDPKSGVAIELVRTGERAILEGEVGGGVRLRLLPKTTAARTGDPLVTSGLGGIYPRGLVVGEVKEVETGLASLEADVSVEPAVKLGRVTDVLIVMGKR